MPFKYAGRVSGGGPTLQVLKAKDTETLSFGDIGNLESGTIDLGATGDATLLGVLVSATVAATSGTTDITVITDPDQILLVADANARDAGATLDLSGATGAQTVAASSNKEFVVYEKKLASQPTKVIFNGGKHVFTKAN